MRIKYYLKLTDFVGSSKAPGHIGEVEVDSIFMKLGGTNSAGFSQDLTFITRDKMAIIKLNRFLLLGKPIDQGEFICETIDQNGNPVVNFKIALKGIVVTALKWIAERSEVTLAYEKIKQEYGKPFIQTNPFQPVLK